MRIIGQSSASEAQIKKWEREESSKEPLSIYVRDEIQLQKWEKAAPNYPFVAAKLAMAERESKMMVTLFVIGVLVFLPLSGVLQIQFKHIAAVRFTGRMLEAMAYLSLASPMLFTKKHIYEILHDKNDTLLTQLKEKSSIEMQGRNIL